MKLPPLIENELAACPVPWEIRNGGSHNKLFIGGRFVAIMPRVNMSMGRNERGNLNIRAQIRRAIKEQT